MRSGELLDLERQAGALAGSETSLYDMLTAGIGPCHHHSVTKSCPTLCNSMNCSPSGSSVHGISQARILEWVAISSSKVYPDPGVEPRSPALAKGFFTTVPPGKPIQVTRCKLLLFSHQVMPDSLQPHGLQHTRLPCPSPPSGVCSSRSNTLTRDLYL